MLIRFGGRLKESWTVNPKSLQESLDASEESILKNLRSCGSLKESEKFLEYGKVLKNLQQVLWRIIRSERSHTTKRLFKNCNQMHMEEFYKDKIKEGSVLKNLYQICKLLKSTKPYISYSCYILQFETLPIRNFSFRFPSNLILILKLNSVTQIILNLISMYCISQFQSSNLPRRSWTSHTMNPKEPWRVLQ